MTRPTVVTFFWKDEDGKNKQECRGFKEIQDFLKMNKGQKFYIEVD